MKYEAKHAKFKIKKRHKAAIVGAVGVAGIGGSIVLSGSAHAATMDEWNGVAQCESGQRWDLQSGDPEGAPGTGASAWGGGLQFQPASWDAAVSNLRAMGVDTSHFGVHASDSTKDQQILAAESLESMPGQGPAAWATVSNGCASLSVSMYDGGPNPWGLLGTDVPAYVLAGDTSAPPVETPDPPAPTPAPVTPPKHDRGPRVHHHIPKHARTHAVVHGDTLWSIARTQLGDGSRWPELYDASNLRSGDPDLIFPGETVVVP